MKTITAFLVFAILCITTPFALAQTKASFKVETLVSDGKKSKQEKSILGFFDTSFNVSMEKTEVKIKEFNYADIKAADYSYAKKPLFSTTKTVVGAVLLGPLFLVTLFIKKKQHWLAIRTESDYVVMKLDNDNFRQVISEFEIRKVKVETVNEDEGSDKKDKK
jgi:hypothetical protein